MQGERRCSKRCAQLAATLRGLLVMSHGVWFSFLASHMRTLCKHSCWSLEEGWGVAAALLLPYARIPGGRQNGCRTSAAARGGGRQKGSRQLTQSGPRLTRVAGVRAMPCRGAGAASCGLTGPRARGAAAGGSVGGQGERRRSCCARTTWPVCSSDVYMPVGLDA